MSDQERIAELVNEFVDGWYERIEHIVRVTNHQGDCKKIVGQLSYTQHRHYHCDCPVDFETRARSVRQEGLIKQLTREVTGYSPVALGERWGGKGSKPPGTLDLLDLVHAIDAWLTCQVSSYTTRERKLRALVTIAGLCDDQWAHEIVRDLRRFRKTARIMLQYDVPARQLRDTVCGECGGDLVVAADADSDVRCVGTLHAPSCGMVYEKWRWVDLLEETMS